jgi:hypothetical protein
MGILNDIKAGISDIISNIIPESKTKSILGNVTLDIIKNKNVTRRKSITNRRTAEGFNIADHAKSEPLMLNITVLDTSNDYLTNRENLIKLYDTGDPITFYYSDRDEYSEVVIENIGESEEYTSKNSFIYDISLRQIETAEFDTTTVTIDYKAASISKAEVKKTKSNNVEATESEETKYNDSWLKSFGT